MPASLLASAPRRKNNTGCASPPLETASTTREKKTTESATLETIKIFLNSFLSADQARFIVADIGNMYLNTKLPSPKYMRIHKKLIPEEIISEYDVMKFTDDNGYTYVEIMGAIYGLAQSRYLAHQDLIKNLEDVPI